LLRSSGVSKTGNGFAAQQSHFQGRKRFCYLATAFAVQEMILLFSKVISRAGNDFAV
jgi:hypothetical protein